MTARTSWMFEDHHPETLGHAGQTLSMAVLRFYVNAIYRPLGLLLNFWTKRNRTP